MSTEAYSGKITFEHQPEEPVGVDIPPLAVNLADRALALADIMDYLNTANRARCTTNLVRNGTSDFVRRYKTDAPKVQKGAQLKADEKIGQFRSGVAVLAGTKELAAQGHDPADIELHYLAMQADINRAYGVGRATAQQRHEVVKKAKRAASHL